MSESCVRGIPAQNRSVDLRLDRLIDSMTVSALILKHQSLIKQIFAFACVGVAATLTHYFVALLVIEAFGISPYIGNLFGYCSAVFVSLFGHGLFTYKRKVDLSVTRKFIVMSVSTFLASEMILFALEHFFSLNHRYSLLVVVMSIPVLTFFLTKFWVYAHPPSQPR